VDVFALRVEAQCGTKPGARVLKGNEGGGSLIWESIG
jgi:hypothetical protein